MTQDEFQKLSIDHQENFINSGGVISSEQVTTAPVHTAEVSDVSSVASDDKIQVGSSKMPLLNESINENESQETESLQPVVFSSSDESLTPEQEQYVEGFDIQDPVELLFLLDDDVATGRVTLSPWQMQIMLDFAEGGESDQNPYQGVVRAPNGSGKDKYVIAACFTWICMRYRQVTCPITSSSGFQLDNQTCKYIRMLCLAANKKWSQIWKCNYRHYICLPTESEMHCYATDEAGKAEGFHPVAHGRKMAIGCSEDKTIPDEIFNAQNKCTGYTHRLHVSTPGPTRGHFYRLCSTGVDRKSIKSVKEVGPTDWIHYHVTYLDCPNISRNYVEQMKRDIPGGENSPAFRSQFWAEFGDLDQMVAIPYTHVWKAIKKSVDDWVQEEHNKAGLDLADGGDETVLAIRNGNRLLKMIPFRFDNSEDTVAFLDQAFRDNGLTHPESYIFGDCCGIGKPILDRLKGMGWKNIRYRDSRAASTLPKTYKNWNAQSWFHLAKLLENKELILIEDQTLIDQLSSRYYKIVDGSIHQLLSKVEQKSKGYPSPDRGDAVVLAFSDYKSTFVSPLEEKEKPFKEEEKKEIIVGTFTLKGHASADREDWGKYRINDGIKDFSDLEEQVAEYNRNKLLVVK